MKLIKLLLLCLVSTFFVTGAAGQTANASLNIITLNSGQVNLGGVVDIQVTVGNTGPGNILANKVRAQISVPAAIVSTLANGQQTGLPPGWTITVNNGSVITVCNGSDVIPAGIQRQVFIKVQGNVLGGPSTVNGSLIFSSGTSCTVPGSLPGDGTSDNTATTSIEVIPAAACNLAVTASAGTIACNGGTTTLTATPTGANGAVEYSITGGAPFQASNIFTLSAGTYTVTAREVNTPACTASATSVTIVQPSALSASATSTPVTTVGGTDGTATATGAGGTAPYSYLWSPGGQTTATATGLSAGTYSVLITDANGCTATATTTVAAPACTLSVSASAGTILCNGGTTTLTATAAGASGAVEYSINGGAFQSGNTFTISAGTYTVTAREVSNPSCTATATPVTVTQPATAITASAIAGSAIVCNGGTTTLTVTASGGTGALEYSLNGGAFQASNTFTVSGGTHIVTVRDANLCTVATTPVTVTQPSAISVSAGITTPIPIPGGTGTITVTASGGTGAKTYVITSGTTINTTGATSGIFTDLLAGSYTFTATDANGCTATASVTLSNPVAGNANASLNILTLNSGIVTQGQTVDIQVTVGNTGPSFIGANKVRAQITVPIAIVSAVANGLQTGLPAGWSITTNTGGVITVCNGTDIIPAGVQRQVLIKVQGNTVGGPSTVNGSLVFSNGVSCAVPGSLNGDNTADNTATTSIQVIAGACNLSVTASAGTIACNGGTTTLTATASGVPGAVEYSLNGGAFQASNTFTVSAGTYTVTAREVATPTCTATATPVTVNQPSLLVASSNATAILCNGGSSTVTVSATGGTAPYTGTGTFSRTAGTYTFTVTDANGCTATSSVTIAQPSLLVASSSATAILCNGGSSTVTVSATGGTAPYTGTGTFSRTAGTYTFTVTDANGCTTTTSVTIAQPSAVTASATSTPVTTTGGTNGTATATAAGGTAPYTYLWTPGGQTTATATGLAAGSYSVLVTDANGCTVTATTTVGSPACNVTLSFTQTNVLCFGASTGSATVTAANTTGTVTYLWSNGQTTATATGLIAGTYSVTVTDGAGCTATGSVTITQPSSAVVAASSATAILCNGGSSTVTVSATGGTAPYTGTGTFSRTAGTYTFTVTDANGCTATTSVTITQPAAITASATSTPVTTTGGTNGTTTVTAAGGTAPYTYLWAPGGQTTATATGLSAGSYSVLVTDANGCTITATTTVGSPACNVTVSVTKTDISCPGSATGTATATAANTTGTVTYLWSNGQTTATATGLTAGTYSVTVTDGAGCTATASVTIATTPDVTNPTITAPATVTVCTNSGCTATGVMLGIPVTADNCTVASVTNNAPAAFPLGTTNVTWTVTDGSGNTATATQTVIVNDCTAPAIYVNQSGLLPGVTGPSSSASPYMVAQKPGVKFRSILSVGDNIGGYQMVGIPDGLGAFDNNNGTFTLLMNHELGNTAGGIRAHGANGAFVSKWVINKSTLQVQSGSDLIQQVYSWNTGTQSSNTTTSTLAFNRFCSADLPSVSAFYNGTTGLGTKARIFMHGEEGGTNGWQMGTVANGPDAGKSYVLGKFNLTTNGSGLTGVGAWENALANPFAQNKTIVIGLNDGGTGIMNNSVSVYVGTKTNTGSEVDKAGLNNGTLAFVNVTGNATEIVNTATRATNIVSGAPFTLSGTTSTVFSRPEDGTWNPANPSQFFFLTTDQYDQVKDGIGAQVGRSRLWRLNFTDITNPATGGTIDLLLDGTEAGNMFDNMGADNYGHLFLQEDVGNQQHNGKIWQYTIATDQLTLLAKHDPARFGEVGQPATAPFNQDEETSGIIDASDILGNGMHLLVDQTHYALASPLVEGGQLLAMFNPESVGATSTAQDTIRVCSGTGVNLGTPATSDNCSVASVTNDAPTTFPVGTTTVTWTVTDGSGNTATATQVVIVSGLTATSSATTILCNGGSSTVTVSATGGTAPYTGTGTFSRAAGTYTFTVTDALGCTATTTITITEPSAITASATSTPVTTTGGTNGTTTVTAAGGTAPYTYLWTPGGQTTATATGLSAGSYSVLVTDANGCTATATTTVGSPACNVTLTFAQTNVSCFGASTGTATVTAAGTSGTVSYLWSNAQTTATATGLVAGNYSITVTDGAGCTAIGSVTISQSAQLVASSSATAILCNGGSSTVTVSATGGTAPYTGTGTFSRTAGTYTFTVTDANACTAVTTITIAPSTATAVVATSTATLIACTGGSSTVTVSATGGTAPYTGIGTFVRTAGTYTFTVTDANGCTGVTTITITQPTLLFASSSAPAIALPGGSSTITVNASGGTAPYTGTGTFVRTAGTYTFTVTDANGCTSNTTITLTDPVAGPANASLNILTLNSGQVTVGGTVDVQVSVGNTGPSFIGPNKVRAQISIPVSIASAVANAQQLGLPAGWIITSNTGGVITVCNGSDIIPAGVQRQILIKVQGTAVGGPLTINGSLLFSNGTSCTVPGSLNGDNTADNTSTTAIQVIAGACNLSVTASAGTISCNGSTTTLTATATGASGAVEYSINGGAFQASNAFTVSAGTYLVTAREVNTPSCSATATAVTITEPTVLVATTTSTPVTTTGGTNGTATATVTGGTAPYNYLWSPSGQTTATATGLSAGSYTVTVMDANECSTTSTIIVGSPACNVTLTFTQINVLCFGASTGTATVTAAGTSGTVSYLWSNGQTTATAAGLVAGTYSVTVTDGAGCTATGSVTIAQPASAVVAASSATVILCNGGSSTVTVSATGGTAPYTGTGTFSRTAGTYTFTVTDANGCTATTSVTITQPAAVTAPIVGAITQPTCAVATGSVVLSGLPATGTWTLTRTPGGVTTTGTGTSTTISGLGAGTYTFTVSNAAGCISAASANVVINAAPASPSAPIVGAITQPTCAVATGSVVLSGLPATGTWTLTRTPGGVTTTGTGTSTTISGLGAGTYTFTVSNAAGCISAASANVVINAAPASPSAPIVGAITQPTCAVATGSVVLSGLPATGTWTLTRTPGGVTTTGTGTSTTISGLGSGTYTFKVTNAAGCISAASANVVINPTPTTLVAASTAPAILCNGGTTTVTVTATGGTPPYTGTGAFVRSAGTYTFTVTDAGGCSAVTTITVTQPTALVASATAGTIACFGGTTSLTVTASGGTGALQYSLNGGAYQSGNNFTVSAGTYTVSVRDANNCIKTTTTVTVAQPTALTVTTTTTPATSGANGTATANVTGGTPPYTYSWNSVPVKTTQTATGLAAGTYTVTVTDARGCIKTATATVVASGCNLVVNAGPDVTLCNAVVLTANVTGVSAPISPATTCNVSYVWKRGTTTVGTTKSIIVIEAGTYTVTATDCRGCVSTDVVVVLPRTLVATAAPTAATLNCYGGTTQVTVSATGGTAPYFGTGTYTVPAGTWYFVVIDSKGCIDTARTIISQPTQVVATATAGTINCYGGTTSVTVTATGGTAPYTGTGTFTKGAGTWNFTVTDAKGCSKVATVTITQPTQLVASVSAPQIACGATTANVTVSATGGTAPYTGTGTFPRAAGTYTFTISDSKGCTVQKTITVTAASCGLVDPNKCYKLIVRHSGKAATVVGSSTANGANIEQRTFGGTNNQIWKFAQVENGFYKITNENSGKVLDVSGGSTANGASVIQWPYGGANNQKWSLTLSGSYFVIKAKHSGKAMSVTGSSGSNGALVEQRGNGSNYNEQWAITEVGCQYMTRGTEEPPVIEVIGKEISLPTELTVSVLPNPSTDYFTLIVKSSNIDAPVSVRILDINGKVLSIHKTGINTSLRVGETKWANGTYLAEVTQGGQRKVVKLIKAD